MEEEGGRWEMEMEMEMESGARQWRMEKNKTFVTFLTMDVGFVHKPVSSK